MLLIFLMRWPGWALTSLFARGVRATGLIETSNVYPRVAPAAHLTEADLLDPNEADRWNAALAAATLKSEYCEAIYDQTSLLACRQRRDETSRGGTGRDGDETRRDGTSRGGRPTYPQLTAHGPLLTRHKSYRLLAVPHPLLTDHTLLTNHCSLLTAHTHPRIHHYCSLPTTHYHPLFTTSADSAGDVKRKSEAVLCTVYLRQHMCSMMPSIPDSGPRSVLVPEKKRRSRPNEPEA